MLVKFAVKNYRGFSEKLEWDLSNPSNFEFNSFAVSNNIIKNGIVYGPNGAGKTNLGLAVFDIVNHLTQKMKMADYYTNFVYAGSPDSLVDFEYTFQFGSDKIDYYYSKDKLGVLKSEVLKRNGEVLLKRDDSEVVLKGFQVDERTLQLLKKGINNFSIVNFIVSSFPLKKSTYLVRLINFVNSMLWYQCLDRRSFIGLETSSSNIEEFIIQNDLVEDFALFLRETSGQVFNFVEHSKDEKKLWCEYNGHKIEFMLLESTGTRSLELLYFWLQKVKDASFVFVDEFDAFYHFDLSYRVCERLFSLKKPQVFVSTHNTYLMTNDLLRPDCNFILKDNDIKSISHRTEKELRLGHNIEKLYRGGTFSR